MIGLLWSKFSGYIIGILSIIGAIAGIYYKGQHDQKVSAEAKQNKKRLEDVKEANKIETNVHNSSDAKLNADLSKWMRD